jgi:hypothetical protein
MGAGVGVELTHARLMRSLRARFGLHETLDRALLAALLSGTTSEPHAAAQPSMGVKPARQGRERASREAIDGETGVIRCADTASPPSSPSSGFAPHEVKADGP